MVPSHLKFQGQQVKEGLALRPHSVGYSELTSHKSKSSICGVEQCAGVKGRRTKVRAQFQGSNDQTADEKTVVDEQATKGYENLEGLNLEGFQPF